MTKDKIFISHSSRDLEIVESFVEHVLRLGLDIQSDRIFCSSMEGHGVKSGQYIPDRLRSEINNSSIALLFISKNYKSSEVCLNELGACWVTLEKENVIPIILPGTDFSNLGFLDFGRQGLKIYEPQGILKLIQDNKEQLRLSFDLTKLHKQIEVFVKTINDSTKEEIQELNEWKDCFDKCLYPFSDIIRRTFPTNRDGIFEVVDPHFQSKLLSELGKAEFLRDLWYRHAEGDYYVEKLSKLPSGNWLISEFNWEVNISRIWVSMNVEQQYEFILIHSMGQEPYKIQSDIGGESYHVGILNDGTIVSENERLNGYAIIRGETISLHDFGIKPRHRDKESHWVFLVTGYHKAGFNADETMQFCEKLDKGLLEVNEDNIMDFLRRLRNHPEILKWR